MQPYMLSQDYMSEKHFYQKMKGYFEEAKQAGYFNSKTVVLLPEYLGTWLVIESEKEMVANASTIQTAMTWMVLSNPITFTRSFFMNRDEADRFAAAIFRMKAKEMARIYGDTFMSLAKEYQIDISAGSIVLPGPTVSENQIHVDATQPLYNTSFVFRSNGEIDSRVVKKSFPILSELPFVTAAPISELQVFDLPIGRTAVLVCADSWYPESYQKINELRAEVVLVNSYCAGNGTMSQKWKGYDGIRRPTDIDTLDIGRIGEREAWIKYAMPGRINSAASTIGMNIFLRGKLWDLGTDGQPLMVKGNALMELKKSERGGIWNLCF